LPDARVVTIAALVWASLVSAGCPKVPTQSAAMEAAPEVTISAQQLQMRDYETGRRFAATIAFAADSIETVAATPQVRMRALRWKVAAIPQAQDAALRTDPLVAAIDLAAFSVQQRDYFTTGEGKDAFGAQQPIAVQAADSMVAQILRELERSVRSGELKPGVRDTLAAWAARNPIRGPGMARISILGSRWGAIGLSDASLSATAGSIDRTMTLVTLRLSYLNESLAEQMRWNAHLMVDEAVTEPGGDSLYRSTQMTMREVGGFAAIAPDVLARERSALSVTLDHERVLAFADVDRQRVEAMKDIDRQRTALQAALRDERIALMADVDRERIATMRSADSLVTNAIARSESALRRLVWEAMGGALVAVAVLGAVGVAVMRRRG
jgi:hypothetical protein